MKERKEYGMNQVIIEDMEYIRSRTENKYLDRSTVLVSGATGLVGKYLVYYLSLIHI